MRRRRDLRRRGCGCDAEANCKGCGRIGASMRLEDILHNRHYQSKGSDHDKGLGLKKWWWYLAYYLNNPHRLGYCQLLSTPKESPKKLWASFWTGSGSIPQIWKYVGGRPLCDETHGSAQGWDWIGFVEFCRVKMSDIWPWKAERADWWRVLLSNKAMQLLFRIGAFFSKGVTVYQIT